MSGDSESECWLRAETVRERVLARVKTVRVSVG
jgi:hypothetical protein